MCSNAQGWLMDSDYKMIWISFALKFQKKEGSFGLKFETFLRHVPSLPGIWIEIIAIS